MLTGDDDAIARMLDEAERRRNVGNKLSSLKESDSSEIWDNQSSDGWHAIFNSVCIQQYESGFGRKMRQMPTH